VQDYRRRLRLQVCLLVFYYLSCVYSSSYLLEECVRYVCNSDVMPKLRERSDFMELQRAKYFDLVALVRNRYEKYVEMSKNRGDYQAPKKIREPKL
jgi:hypothetical protein